jgi:Membrane bound O-acyl transferase family
MFGDFRRLTTLRYFWGSFWHQGIRKVSQVSKLQSYDAIDNYLDFVGVYTILPAYTAGPPTYCTLLFLDALLHLRPLRIVSWIRSLRTANARQYF